MLKNLKLDAFGMGASIICAIHCATIPFLVSFAASAGLNILQSHWFEYSILALAVIFVLSSLVPSYFNHRKLLPLVVAISGLVAVFVNHWVWGHSSYWLSFFGALAITYAHYKNFRLNKTL